MTDIWFFFGHLASFRALTGLMVNDYLLFLPRDITSDFLFATLGNKSFPKGVDGLLLKKRICS